MKDDATNKVQILTSPKPITYTREWLLALQNSPSSQLPATDIAAIAATMKSAGEQPSAPPTRKRR